MANNTEQRTLDEINSWDDVSEDVDLFDQLNDAEPVDDNKETEESEPTDQVKEEETKVEPETQQENRQEETGEDKEESDKEDLFDPNANLATEEDLPKNNENSALRGVYDYLVTNQFIKSSEDFDVENASDQDISDFIEDSFDNEVTSSIKEMLNDLPDFVKDLNKYVLNGGDFNTFIQHYQENNIDTTGLDINDKETQESIVRQYLQSQGFDNDYIGLQLEFLNDSGKLESTAKKQFDVVQKRIKEQREMAIKEQEAKIEQLKEREREYKQSLNTYVSQTDNIGDLVLTRDDKKHLSNYVSERNVKLTNGTYITEMQKELYYDIPQNQEAMLQLALLLRNRNKDGTFNFNNIKKQVETKITRNIKNNMRRNKSSRPTDTNVERRSSRRTLADYFD